MYLFDVHSVAWMKCSNNKFVKFTTCFYHSNSTLQNSGLIELSKNSPKSITLWTIIMLIFNIVSEVRISIETSKFADRHWIGSKCIGKGKKSNVFNTFNTVQYISSSDLFIDVDSSLEEILDFHWVYEEESMLSMTSKIFQIILFMR